MTRRKFIKILGYGAGGLTLALGGSVALLANSRYYAPRRIVVEDVTVPVKDLPAGFEGFKICQLTDIHHGYQVEMEFVDKALDIALRLNPDIYALTGDYASYKTKFADAVIGRLATLRGVYDTVAVLGNHDHWVGGYKYVPAVLRRSGIGLLNNTHIILERDGGKLCIAGVDDLRVGRPDLGQALYGVPQDMPRILLSHNPDLADEKLGDNRVDLMLSGHTHGGQIRLPFSLYAPYTNSRYGQKYTGGFVKTGNTLVYVSRGIGTITIPIRFNCPPEITLLRLVKA
ncbi:hypothetical protein MNBD_DELTA02-537 [hydrothermal vent metagenome]|uniref:Calcineurin-like phosphoesterase domain-containing protein n=1 Tax=hydrothermal vent metagenome TaxID=652676 RepID=A0A3B0VXT3_9ZZZZ